MQCPKCTKDLLPETPDALLYTCAGCKGVWLRSGQLEGFLRETASARGVVLNVIGLVETPPKITSLSCPECATRLDRIGYRGIQVERCPKCHGVYADAGEREELARRVLKARSGWESAYHSWQELTTRQQAERRGEREAAAEAAAIGMATIAGE